MILLSELYQEVGLQFLCLRAQALQHCVVSEDWRKVTPKL